MVQGLDLIVEHGRGQVSVDGAVPRRAASRRAPTVGDDDSEPLVGEPLRRQVGVVGAHDTRPVGAAVGVEEDRER